VYSVEFQGVSKSYPIYDSPGDRLKELLTLNRRQYRRDFWALRDVSFEVRRGETFCIIGENGSGKSTLLQIVAGILAPTSGQVQVNGRVSALLELGSGFNPEFTGRDNVYLNAAILGFSKAEIDRRFRDIADFAEIGSFMDQPVKTYSNGMAVRLAFAVAIHVDPEILLVDEALAVGDIYFRQRCMRKVHELRSRGVTILFVSHSIPDVKALGDRTLWLDQGRVRELGRTDKVVERFMAAMSEKDSAYVHQHRVPGGRAFLSSGARPGGGGAHSEHRSPLRRRPGRGHRHHRAGCSGTSPADAGASLVHRGPHQRPRP
jgi:lipopolysaccharide transport system ATP-binding protein